MTFSETVDPALHASMTNALVPPYFDHLDPQQSKIKVLELLEEGNSLINSLEKIDAPTWDASIQPIIDINEQISYHSGLIRHLCAVKNSPQWREANHQTLPAITSFFTQLNQNQALFKAYQCILHSTTSNALPPARKRLLELAIQDSTLSGAQLEKSQQTKFLELKKEEAALCTKFSENIMDATDAYCEIITDKNMLTGIPQDVLSEAQLAAKKDNRPGWKLNLRAPCYQPIMQFADNRDLRERFYKVYGVRASEINTQNKHWDNGPIIAKILKARQKEAELLGYQHYADLSIDTKMAESTEDVLGFLKKIAKSAKVVAEKELATLKQFAKEHLNIDDIKPWDIAWASEKLKQHLYGFSNQEVKSYFNQSVVLEGLFKVIKHLFDIDTKLSLPESAWDENVMLANFYHENKLIGQCFLDLAAREHKQSGAWMDECITRRRTADGDIQIPVAYLICNFSTCKNHEPVTLFHHEVETLFHEFGHVLHHLLTQVEDLWVSGIQGVEWDAVELPSQFMENFFWDYETLRIMTQHIKTQKPLPKELYEKMLAAKQFQAGMHTLRQVEFALFDLLLHQDTYHAEDISQAQSLLKNIRHDIAIIFPPEWHRFANSFSHIFAGGYAAGYYSYLWAEVLSSDAFSVFQKGLSQNESMLSSMKVRKLGKQFKDKILAYGGSRPAKESFIDFRGQEPDLNSFLASKGILTNEIQ